MSTYLFFDTETASFKGPIMQLAFMVTDSKGVINYQWSGFLAHGFEYEVSEDAQKIHGFTRERCEKEGNKVDGVLLSVVNAMGAVDRIVCHNSAFDMRMVRLDAERHAITFPEINKSRQFCTMSNRDILRHCKSAGNISLGKLHTHLFGNHHTQAHDADNDMEATAKCFFELKRRGII